MRQFLCLLLLAFVILTSLGCTAPALKGPPPFLGLEAQSRLAARAAALHSLEGEFKLDYSESLAHERADLYLAVSRPGNLTLELSGPLGLIAAATSNDRNFVFFDARKKQGYVGPVEIETISRLLPISIAPKDLVPLLLAAPTPLGQATSTELAADRKVGLWRLSFVDEAHGLVQHAWFSADGRLARIRLTEKGHLIYDVSYLAYGDASGPTAYPHLIKLRSGARPKAEVKLSLRGEATLNTELPAERFELALPPTCDRLVF